MDNRFISYLITDPSYYSSDPQLFKQRLTHVLKNNKIQYACFRDKESHNFEALASVFVQVCQSFQIEQILINQNIEVALKMGASGVHLTSNQFEQIQEAKSHDLYTLISTHSLSQIQRAQDAHVHGVTFSPIYHSPNKGNPKGIDALKTAIGFYDIDIIALGGIVTQEQVEKIKQTQARGFASIRYFIPSQV